MPSSKRSSLVSSALSRRIDIAAGPWCDLDAFYADAVSALWELTMTWSGAYRPYAVGDLLSAVRTRMRTLQASEHRHRSRQTGTPDALDTLPASSGRTGEELLAAALADATGNGLNVADAAVLYATRVLGMSLGEVADLAGIPAHHLQAAKAERHRPDGGLRCARRRPSPISALRSGRHHGAAQQGRARCAGRVGQCGMTAATFPTGHDAFVSAECEQARLNR